MGRFEGFWSGGGKFVVVVMGGIGGVVFCLRICLFWFFLWLDVISVGLFRLNFMYIYGIIGCIVNCIFVL